MHAAVSDRIELICPGCRRHGSKGIIQFPLKIAKVFHWERDHILEGILECTGAHCRRTYPIIDGVPVLLKDICGWWNSVKTGFCGEWGHSSEIRAFFKSLGCQERETLQEQCQLGSIIECHYDAPMNPPALPAGLGDPQVFWNTAAEIIRSVGDGPYHCALDLGCAVGRFTGELSRMSDLAVGIDTNFKAVAFAAELHRYGRATWARRIRGRWFEKSRITATPRQNVCFLVADALNPPFAAAGFDLVAGLNLLDSVRLPLVLLGQMDALLNDTGKLMVSSPYEWRPDICDPSEWLEAENLEASVVVRRILRGAIRPETGFHYKILQERDWIPWILRNHNRYWSLFFVHMMLAEKQPRHRNPSIAESVCGR